jgi:hypothetical protein
MGRTKKCHSRADRAGMADGAEAVDRAHPGYDADGHMLDNIGADQVRFTLPELAELNASVAAIDIRGARLPDQVLVFSGVEAPAKK